MVITVYCFQDPSSTGMIRKSNSSSGGTKRSQAPQKHHSKPHTGSLSAGSTKTWDMGRNLKNSNPLSTVALASHLVGASGVDPESVMQLVNDVRWFADVLHNLKEAFNCKENLEDLQKVVQERLSDLVRVLKAVIGKHQTLNSSDILGAAGMVIAKVKGINFKEVAPENTKATFGEIHTSIDTLAFTFGNVVSDFLMGDVDSTSGLGPGRSRSFDNLSVDPEGYVLEKSDPVGPVVPLSREEEVDLTLLKNDSGVESALLYAKAWSKHIKDLLTWMEKRLAMDIECARMYTKMAESAKALASHQDYMPFSDVYVSTFKNDMDYRQLIIQTAMALQTNKFMQPLMARKTELDKLRKDLKEQWQREQKKMQEADATLRKARALKAQRSEEYQKAHTSTSRSQEEPSSVANKQLEKKRRLAEEALQRAEEAQDQYQSCAADAGVRKMDLANAKSTILTQIREMVFQCDLTLKAVTVNWFQMQQAQLESLPAHYLAVTESAKLYEPGECYAEFARNLPKNLPKERLLSDPDNTRFVYNQRSVGSTHSSHGNLSQTSITSGDVLSGDEVDIALQQPAKISGSTDAQALRGQIALRNWASAGQASHGGMCSDSESAGGSSESRSMDSPTASPGDFKRRLLRTPSTGTMSSADDLDEREPPSPTVLAEMVTETASSPGPFRNAQMSKAAQTHKLRKLRAPSKCRECDSLVVFHGAECGECSLACHKKCLETLAIQCGHKKLQGRLQLFGIDFAQAAKNSPDGIPFIIKKCASEIESRALNIKGIYRVNGAKSRVEKLCQAFENGKDLVELSDHSPHDISNVLKLYLRQLPEPLILYRHYNDLIGLAKECQKVIVEEVDKLQSTAAVEKERPSVQLNRVIFRIRDFLQQLPAANYRTLRFLIAHLSRVSEQAEENKMTASNLGIIFGPTLIKPRQTDAEVSLSSLVDYPYQALLVEMMVRHFLTVFDTSLMPAATADLSAGGQASPRLTPQEKLQRLSRHSTSLVDIKESAKVYKRYSSVIPSSHILNEVQEVQPGKDGTDGTNVAAVTDGLNAGVGVRRSCPPPARASGSSSSNHAAPKVQLRTQRGRHASRPISMPLERLPAPPQVSERANRLAAAASPELDSVSETKQEVAETESGRPSISSRVSTYYITPFMDTQTLHRKTWDKKYRHYDVTPRTAMIMANLPPATSGVLPVMTSSPGPSPSPTPAPAHALTPPTVRSSVSTMFSGNLCTTRAVQTSRTEDASEGGTSVSEPLTSSTDLLLTLRQPRTLHPPPETFYKPPAPATSRARTLPSWTTTVTTVTTVTTTAAAAASTPPTGQLLLAQDSADSAIDPGASASASPSSLSPLLTPPLSSPEDFYSGGEVKPVYQRLRPRRLQELEQREAHFV